jgi:hypothetical protein
MPHILSRVARATVALLALVATIVMMLSAPHARADACKPDGKQCATNVSCCSRNCMKTTARHGKALFGICCTPTTCRAGVDCGTIPDGDCTGFTLDCGTCTSPDTCGGGGVSNQCGCTPITTCPAGDDCGSVPDGCGGTLNCGTCTAPNSCGGGGTMNVCGCTPTTCSAADCGMTADGCGGTLDCGDCQPTTTSTTTSTSTPASTTTTIAGPPTCANGGFPCGLSGCGNCGGSCVAPESAPCPTSNPIHCGSSSPVCVNFAACPAKGCTSDAECPAGNACVGDSAFGCADLGGFYNQCCPICPE